MLQTAMNIFSVPDLRRRILFTAGLLAIYRVGEYIPLPGVNHAAILERMNDTGSGSLGSLLQHLSMFSGGSLSQSMLFGLGIMPYISASIIFQLLATVYPPLEKLKDEGEAGRRKINEYTRYATVVLCLIQATFWLRYVQTGDASSLVHNTCREGIGSVAFWCMGLAGMTAGTMFLMWLGEQIDEYGIGNGISLIIMAGIVARIPDALQKLILQTDVSAVVAGDSNKHSLPAVLVLMAAFVGVVATTVLITQAQRRIPIQTAKQVRGRKLYGGQRNYLPLRLNASGVMPIIFASSLMLFPAMLTQWLYSNFGESSSVTVRTVVSFLAREFEYGAFMYLVSEGLMIIFFSYFWTSVQFQPKKLARDLQDNGTFIPGLRPGPRTADYVERVLERLTYVGAGFLCAIALVPTILAREVGIEPSIASFLGGTGLLITVSVSLDLLQRIEASLSMHNYSGFLGGNTKLGGGGGY